MIKYIVKLKKNPKDTTKSAFYPVIVKIGSVGLDRIARDIDNECTVTEHDMKGVLSALEQHIISELQNGHSVRLDDLGGQGIRWQAACGVTRVNTRLFDMLHDAADKHGFTISQTVHINF